jgi:hypothetical protein
MFKLLIMKKVLLLLVFIPLLTFGQKLNKDSNGYTEVVEVELTKQQIYQKAIEWVALNYKSANDVIQLNTEDKLVIKGNYTFTYPSGEAYIIRNTTTISIRDNKYKIDLIPTSAIIKATMKDALSTFIQQFFVDEASTFELYKPWHRNNVLKIYKNMGYSEKRALKLADKNITEEVQKESFESRQAIFSNWNNSIKSTFTSIKDYVAKSDSDDDW